MGAALLNGIAMTPTLGRYVRTLRHLGAGQIGWRIFREAERRVERRARPLARLRHRPDRHARIVGEPLHSPPLELLFREREMAERFRAGRVLHLGIEGDRGDWSGLGRSRLWRYERQYHAELLALAACAVADPGGPWADEACALVASWAMSCPPGTDDAWEPYPTARRILSWSLAAALAPPLHRALAPLLAPQLGFLAAHLERDLLGNHLLCDAAALCAGSAVLDARGARAAGRTGAALLARELERQVLADGGYAERTVQYHTIVLCDALVALGLSRRRGRALGAAVEAPVARMARWLALVRRHDGSLPWLNDAAPDLTPPVDEVLGLAAGLGLVEGGWDGWRRRAFAGAPRGPVPASAHGDLALADTGWSIVRDGAHELLFEHGPIGPPEQPGHGHSDALSFELLWDGTPIVTDTGVTTYDPGPLRAFERSAEAHAAVTVDGEGPDELWAAFRVGGRARVHGGASGRGGRVRVMRGRLVSPRGYAHERGILYWPGGALVVLDRVAGAAPERARSHLPLAEGCRLDGETLRAGAVTLRFEVLWGRLAPAREGRVGRGFGRALPRPSLVLRFASDGRSVFALAAPGVSVELRGASCRLRAKGVTFTLPLAPDGLPR